MTSLFLVVISFVAVALVLALSRSARTRRHAGSTTVDLVVDDGRIERRLADGRTEAVDVAALRWIEVVCTKVPTADGAEAFALLAESGERGCLVPLGVGIDADAVSALAALPGFDLRAFSEACDQRGPTRTVVWGEPDL